MTVQRALPRVAETVRPSFSITPVSPPEHIVTSVAEMRYKALVDCDPRWQRIINCQNKLHYQNALCGDEDRLDFSYVDSAVTLKSFFAELHAGASEGAESKVWRYFRDSLGGKGVLRKITYLHQKIWREAFLFSFGDIPVEEVMAVSFDFLDDSEFWNANDPHARALRRVLQKEKVDAKKLTPLEKELHGGCIGLANSTMTRFTLGPFTIDPRNNTLFGPSFLQVREVLSELLSHYGERVMPEENSPLHVLAATALFTTKEKGGQAAHRDFDDNVLLNSGTPLPWSADIPISDGGLFLNLWRGYDNEFVDSARLPTPPPLMNFAIKVHIPFKSIMLWRGDLVHGGGYDNELGNGALRIHWYIPMKPSDEGSVCGATPNINTVDYNTIRRFTGFLVASDGSILSSK